MAKEMIITKMTGTPSLDCQHYWLVETPNGHYSQAVCKYCGLTKEFLNSPPEPPSKPRRTTSQ